MGWWVILKTTSFSLSPPLTFLLWYVFMIHSACHAETYWEILRGRKETRFSCLLLLQLSYPSLPYYHVTQIFPLICSLWWQTLLAGHWQMGNQGNHRKYYDPTLANCIKIQELIFPCSLIHLHSVIWAHFSLLHLLLESPHLVTFLAFPTGEVSFTRKVITFLINYNVKVHRTFLL